jgi:chromosome segregation ATPase
MQKNIDSLRKEVAKQKETIDNLKKKNHSIMQSFDDTEMELTNKAKEVSRLKMENEEFKKQQEGKEGEKDVISEIPSLKGKIAQLETNLEIAKESIQSKSSLLSERDSLIAKLKSEIEEYEETNTSLSDSLTK